MKLEDYTLTFNYYIKEVKESVPSTPKKDTMTFRTVLIIILIIILSLKRRKEIIKFMRIILI